MSVTTEWDPTAEAYASWVELEMTSDTGVTQSEYRTQFTLPPGVFVADYYLYVGDRKEPGILAERRAATWIYQQITSARRDPGLLRYVGDNRLDLRVFPFAHRETRRTGFELLHKEPVSFVLDGQTVQLGATGGAAYDGVLSNMRYVTARDKAALAQVQRKGRLHFLLDGSRRGTPEAETTMLNEMARLNAEYGDPKRSPQITLAGTYPVTIAEGADVATSLEATSAGGFFAQRALETILREERYGTPDLEFPRIILLSAGTQPILTDELSAFAAALPEDPAYYRLAADGSLRRQPLIATDTAKGWQTPGPVYAWPNPIYPKYFLSLNSGPALVAREGKRWTGSADRWTTAAHLYAEHLHHRRTGATGYRPWLSEVRGSFAAQVLMPTTAFLVVENEAQKEALRRKQEQTLQADPNFDVGEETRRMSEPGEWLLLLLPVLLFQFRRKLL
ncbi:MAG: MSEP-CTERM sorting domain-containing protein [Bacteroidota bacterium]